MFMKCYEIFVSNNLIGSTIGPVILLETSQLIWSFMWYVLKILNLILVPKASEFRLVNLVIHPIQKQTFTAILQNKY